MFRSYDALIMISYAQRVLSFVSEASNLIIRKNFSSVAFILDELGVIYSVLCAPVLADACISASL